MKKIFFYILAGSLCFSACKDDEEIVGYKEPENIAVQNTYDDESIQKFLDENYLDAQGNIKAFSSTDAADDNEIKLKDLSPAPVKLNSGVVYIVRNGAQPTPGTAIGDMDVMRIMMRSRAYLAANTEGKTAFFNSTEFAGFSSLDYTGSPVNDPAFYYARQALISASTPKSYYEMEGFQEAIKYFKAFNQDDAANYNLQGAIIVPSRAAYARDNHSSFGAGGTNPYRNKSFVFNFQVYKTRARLDSEK